MEGFLSTTRRGIRRTTFGELAGGRCVAKGGIHQESLGPATDDGLCLPIVVLTGWAEGDGPEVVTSRGTEAESRFRDVRTSGHLSRKHLARANRFPRR